MHRADELDEGMKVLFAADGPALLHVHTDAELVLRALPALARADPSPDETAAVDTHLDGCEACRHYLDQMRVTIATLGSVPVPVLSAEACGALMAAFARSGPAGGG